MKQARKRRGSKPRTPLSDEERIRLALARYGSLNAGRNPRSYAHIYKEFKRSPTVVARAIKECFQRGLVAVAATDGIGPVSLNEVVKSEFLDAFPLLNGATIVTTPSAAPSEATDSLVAHDSIASLGPMVRYGIVVHKLIGSAMANFIAHGAVIRSGDSIAVGSGRAVFYCVEALRKALPLRAHDITLLALTGSLHVRGSDEPVNHHLDSDTHLSILGPVFQKRVTLEPISHVISVGNPDARPEVVGQTWLGTWKAESDPDVIVPTHALVGIGVLGKGHRLYDLVKADLARQGTASRVDPVLLKHLNPYLSTLIKVCDKYVGRGIYPVGDLSNYLFWIEPAHGARIPDDDRQAVQDCIRELNRRLITANPRIFAAIRNIMVVSGTVEKAGALFTLLEQKNPDLKKVSISHLCTDTETARVLIALKRGQPSHQ